MSGLCVLCSIDMGWLRVSRVFEIDGVALFLVGLRVWVVALRVIGSCRIKNMGLMRGRFLIVMFGLLGLLISRFRVCDYIYFYVLFEACLIPILVLVLG